VTTEYQNPPVARRKFATLPYETRERVLKHYAHLMAVVASGNTCRDHGYNGQQLSDAQRNGLRWGTDCLGEFIIDGHGEADRLTGIWLAEMDAKWRNAAVAS